MDDGGNSSIGEGGLRAISDPESNSENIGEKWKNGRVSDKSDKNAMFLGLTH